MGYKTKSMINQASGIDAFSLLDKEAKKIGVNSVMPKTGFGSGKLNKGFSTVNGLPSPSSNSTSTNPSKEEPSKKQSNRAYRKQAKSIGTYINKGGEKGYKKSQRKEARAVGKEAAKNVDTSFEGAKLAGTDFNSLLIGTIQNISSSAKASSKKRKVKRAARKEHQELQKKGSSNFDGKGLKEGFKGADLPKIDSGIKTGDFFQNTFNKFNTERDKRIKKQASEKIKNEKLNELAPKKVLGEQVKPMYNYGPLAPKTVDMNKDFGRKIYDVTQQTGKDAKYALTRGASKEMEQKQRDLNALEMYDEARKVGQQFTKDRRFAEDYLKNTPKKTNDFDAKLKKGREDIAKERQLKSQAETEAAKKRLGIQMTGDGFNKGMLRKNKYKK